MVRSARVSVELVENERPKESDQLTIDLNIELKTRLKYVVFRMLYNLVMVKLNNEFGSCDSVNKPEFDTKFKVFNCHIKRWSEWFFVSLQPKHTTRYFRCQWPNFKCTVTAIRQSPVRLTSSFRFVPSEFPMDFVNMPFS